jgi:hypothetical protein
MSMKPIITAVIIKAYGNPVPSGGYELFLTDAQLAQVSPRSVIREYHDPIMHRTVLHLSDSPIVIDIKAIHPDEAESPLPAKL